MSGFFTNGKWYENADLKCRQCQRPLYETDDMPGLFHCFGCSVDFEISEADEQDASYIPKVLVARPVDGITINEELEYLMDDTGKNEQVFAGQPDAEAWLMTIGISANDLEYFYFIECQEEPAESS